MTCLDDSRVSGGDDDMFLDYSPNDNNLRQVDMVHSPRTSRAFYVSIARVVLRAEAYAGVRGGLALRVKAALGRQASVRASAVQAILVVGAILVQVTLHVAQH